jgi:hypothetical protein
MRIQVFKAVFPGWAALGVGSLMRCGFPPPGCLIETAAPAVWPVKMQFLLCVCVCVYQLGAIVRQRQCCSVIVSC